MVMIKRIALVMIMSLSYSFHSNATEQWDNGGLEISYNNRYIQHKNGKPFFWFGDTAWSIFYRLDVNEARTYFSDRKNKGFTIIQATALGAGLHAMDPGHNIVNGEVPFLDNDPTKPNEKWFRHADHIIDLAKEYNLYVGFLPVWKPYICPGWEQDPVLFNRYNAKTYGEFIGNRYRDKPNIVYILGGDIKGDHCDIEIWRAMAEGIKSKDTNHLITYHPNGHKSSAEWFHSDSWLNFNMIQSKKPSRIFSIITETYNKKPTKPVLNGEPCYYGYHDPPYLCILTGPEQRSQAYVSILSGGFGYTYGQRYIWSFHKRDTNNNYVNHEPTEHYWTDYLDTEGTRWILIWKDVMHSIDWWKLVPDQSIITYGEGRGNRRTISARSSGGDLLVVYYPNRKTCGIDLSKITDAYLNIAPARWWNPKNNVQKIIGNVKTNGFQSFTPPSGWEDAILIIGGSEERKIAKPVISPNGGNHMGSVTVSLHTTTLEAEIYYTTDRSTPTTGK